MQSFIQYRNIGQRLESQINRARHRSPPLQSTESQSSLEAPLPEETDLEIGKHELDGLAGDSASRDDRTPEWRREVQQLRRNDSEDKAALSAEQNLEEYPPAPALQEESRAKNEVEIEKEVEPIDQEGYGEDALPQNTRSRPALSRLSTTRSNRTIGTKLGLSLTGIDVRDRTKHEGGDRSRQAFVVGYQGDDDPMNPHNWSFWKRFYATILVASIGAVVGLASSIDASALTYAAKEFGVSEVVESLATGIYLVGFGVGALVAGPFSETLGRNPIYIVTLTLFMVFIMASALAPNIGAQLAFRFLAGVFGSTPLTCAGGSVADMWSPMERVYAFPLFANAAFMGPIIGPIMGGFIVESNVLTTWRWTEWVTLITSGLILVLIILFQPETYSGIILTWKAQHLRRLTSDDRYVAPMEIRAETFVHRLTHALYRPFVLTATEPIIMFIALYLTVIYIILFTFFDGYNYIFAEIHGLSDGLTGVCFAGIAIGLCLASALVPLIYVWAKRDLKKIKEAGGEKLPPEFRLWFSMLGGSISIPISLYWMAWTSDSSISIWSPLAASVLFGYGILCVFISSYQYIIDSYEAYSASALASVTLIRYVAAGGMVVVGIPFYENLGVHYTLTILGCIAALMAPLPYIFYKIGPKIRARSNYAITSTE